MSLIYISFAAWVVVLILNNLTSIKNQIIEIRGEDRQALVAHCNSLMTTFEKLRRKQMMESIQAQTQNTLVAAQQASAARQAVDNQSEQMAALQEENAQLKEIIEKQSKKLEIQGAQLQSLIEGQRQMNILLGQMQPLLKQKNEAVDKKA